MFVPNGFNLKPNGCLPLSLGWRGAFHAFSITGGPYDAFPRGRAFGVCVRAERKPRPEDMDVHLPIRDFDVPEDDAAVAEALRRTLAAALEGRSVYVGCMGGWGRAGLFMALLAKVCWQDDPIGYVRELYTPRAVETEAQTHYVRTFDVAELRVWLARTAWAMRLPPLARLIAPPRG